MIHRGGIVEKIVRKSGFSLTKLAQKLAISRNTLYNRFENPDLSYRFILDVGNIIHYDFSIDFPEIKAELSDKFFTSNFDNKETARWKIESKYTVLLEKHNKLMGILVKLTNETNTPLKKEIIDLID